MDAVKDEVTESYDVVDLTEQEEQASRDREIIDDDVTIKKNFFDVNIKPGHFSYDVLSQKFGIDDLDLSIINEQVGGFLNFDDISFPRVVENNRELQEYVLHHAFKSSGFDVDPSVVRSLFDKLKFTVRDDGRLQAVVEISTTKYNNFFIMDKNGDIEYFTKRSRKEYRNDNEHRHKMSLSYLDGYGIDKRIIFDIKSNAVYSGVKEVVETTDVRVRTDMAKSMVEKINDITSDEIQLSEMHDTPETKEQFSIIKNVKEGLNRLINKEAETNIDKDGIDNVKEDADADAAANTDLDIGSFEDIKFIEESLERLDETMPLKFRLKNIIKEHGITIASLTVMVSTIITSIATSLANSAKSVTTGSSSKVKEEIEKIKEENEKLKEDEIKNKDKIEENDKKIKELEDKVGKGKTVWDYVKQVAGYILTGLSALLSFIGAIISFIGKALLGFSWIVYVIIAALAALAYGYYEKKDE